MRSIILPACIPDEQNLEYLRRFFETLEKYTSDYQLIIIDNGSKFGSELMREKADIYIRKDYPMGYGRAANAGLSLADHDILVLASTDIFLTERWLEKLLENLDEKNRIVCATDKPVEFKQAGWGALWLMPREVFTKVGYFDEHINTRFIDQDYWIRAGKLGFITYQANVIVGHINEATTRVLGQDKRWPLEEQLMLQKHGVESYKKWARSQS